MQKKHGFTLIELVIVIIVLAVLASVAVPKLLSSKSIEAETYRSQLLLLLKTTQQQAMSCDDSCRNTRASNPYACNTVFITADRFGIATQCRNNVLPTTFSVPHLGMSQVEADNSSVRFSAGEVIFNDLGVATIDGRACNTGCNIVVTGEKSLTIRIEAQGYIHAI